MKHGAVVALVALAALLSGCPPTETEFFWEERFESACDGAPCGWVVGAGPTGSALWVETLPGEHAVALYGDRVAILGPVDGVESDMTLEATSLIAYLSARCDEEATLEVEVSVADLTSGRIDSYRGTVAPAPTWDGGVSSVALRRVGGSLGSSFFRDVVAIRVLKAGPGVCEIGELGLAAPAGFRF